jgi:hypothetical protein
MKLSIVVPVSNERDLAPQALARIDLKEDRFGFEPEITAKVARLGCRIYEVPVSYSGRTYAEVKKINWKDGFSALRCILQYNLLG